MRPSPKYDRRRAFVNGTSRLPVVTSRHSATLWWRGDHFDEIQLIKRLAFYVQQQMAVANTSSPEAGVFMFTWPRFFFIDVLENIRNMVITLNILESNFSYLKHFSILYLWNYSTYKTRYVYAPIGINAWPITVATITKDFSGRNRSCMLKKWLL